MSTRIDEAFAVMELSDTDAGALRFYEAVLEAELVLLLAQSADGDLVRPKIFETSEGAFAMAFDTGLRLAEFAGEAADCVEISGRNLVALLTDQDLGLALNLSAPSESILPRDVISWMHHERAEPDELEARPEEIKPPSLPEEVLTILDRKLAGMVGFAEHAYLADAVYETGASASILAFIDAVGGSEKAIADAIAEAFHFSGFEAISLDVIFLSASDPISGVFAKYGLRFDLPKPEEPITPGSDPASPPKLI